MATARSALRQAIGYMLGGGQSPVIVVGTPTGSFSTTGFACSSLAQYPDDHFNTGWIHFYSGTHKDVTRNVSDFAASGGTVTLDPAVTGAIDATDLFELWWGYNPDDIDQYINQAIQSVEDEWLPDSLDESLVAHDALTDGLFESWTNSSTLANWSTGGTGTLARESTIKREGNYSAKLTNTIGNAFYLYQSLGNYPMYAGLAVSLYARVSCNTASRVRLQLEDGVNTWNSSYHDGAGWRDSATDPWFSILSKTVSTAATQLTASARTETGTAVTAYVDKMYLKTPFEIYEYTLPSTMFALHTVTPESATIDRFYPGDAIPRENWRIVRLGTSARLWLDPANVVLDVGRKIRLEGQALASTLSLDADTTMVPAEYLKWRALGLAFLANGEEKRAAVALTEAEKERRKVHSNIRGQRVW